MRRVTFSTAHQRPPSRASAAAASALSRRNAMRSCKCGVCQVVGVCNGQLNPVVILGVPYDVCTSGLLLQQPLLRACATLLDGSCRHNAATARHHERAHAQTDDVGAEHALYLGAAHLLRGGYAQNIKTLIVNYEPQNINPKP